MIFVQNELFNKWLEPVVNCNYKMQTSQQNKQMSMYTQRSILAYTYYISNNTLCFPYGQIYNKILFLWWRNIAKAVYFYKNLLKNIYEVVRNQDSILEQYKELDNILLHELVLDACIVSVRKLDENVHMHVQVHWLRFEQWKS